MRVTAYAGALIALLGCSRYEYRPTTCPEPASHSAIAWQYAATHGRTVEGVIVKIDSLRPLPSGMITLEADSRQWRPDAAGKFRLDSLAPGAYTLRISAPGYVPAESRIILEESSGVQFVAAMERYRVVLDGCGAVLLPVRKPWWKIW